jgi:transposase
VAATLARMSEGPPLPLPRPDAVVVAVGVELVEDAGVGGAVFVWGNAAWCWQPGDGTARRLAAVQLVATGAASQRQVGEAFGVNENTVWRWRQAYAAGGVEGLAERRRGPRGPSKLTGAKVAEIVAARAEGSSMETIAARVGVSLNSVSRALKPSRALEPPAGTPVDVPPGEAATGTTAAPAVGEAPEDARVAGQGGLAPLARPAARTAERQAARAGLLAEAPPVVCQGAGLPLAGALTLLPALATTGLVEVAERVYAAPRAAFYGLRSLLLTLVFAAAVGAPRAEGLVRLDPVDLGRLLGLDRAPEVKTVRRRVGELAAAGRSAALIEGLARRHVDANPEAVGIFYVDGHVRAYHGGAQVPKHHLARMRISMPAEEDIWVGDARGEGLLVWQADPGASLVGELRTVAAHVRALVGPDARPTICFDRGGWSPKLFAELDAAGFDILTYRKGVKTPEPASAFTTSTLTDDRGVVQIYELADRRVRIAYDSGRRRFACRQITRRSANGHQTQILTTRTDADPAPIAYLMFSRWRQENFFRYLRHRYALDALDAYATVPDDPDRTVPNPARRAANAHADALAAAIDDAQADLDRRTAAGVDPWARDAHQGLADELDTARAALAERTAAAKATPGRAPISEVRPDSRRLDPERKRIHDAVRMATYNAESALARLLGAHYPRASDEARTLLAEIFTAPADLQVINNELHVRVHPLSAARRTRALTGLCADLTATRTTYPGTDLTLVYTVKQR